MSSCGAKNGELSVPGAAATAGRGARTAGRVRILSSPGRSCLTLARVRVLPAQTHMSDPADLNIELGEPDAAPEYQVRIRRNSTCLTCWKHAVFPPGSPLWFLLHSLHVPFFHPNQIPSPSPCSRVRVAELVEPKPCRAAARNAAAVSPLDRRHQAPGGCARARRQHVRPAVSR